MNGNGVFSRMNSAQPGYTSCLIPRDVYSENGRVVLMEKGTLGIIAEGAYADLLIVEGNPLVDLGVLMNPQKNLKFIMKDGVVHKNELAA